MKTEIYLEFEDFVKRSYNAKNIEDAQNLYNDCIETGKNKERAKFSNIYLRILNSKNIPEEYRKLILQELQNEDIGMKVFSNSNSKKLLNIFMEGKVEWTSHIRNKTKDLNIVFGELYKNYPKEEVDEFKQYLWARGYLK